MNKCQYFSIYKPYLCLSQFTREGEAKCLKDYFDFQQDIYPVGRLDSDSEGLLLLTNDARVNTQLLHPKNFHQKTYWAQVEGCANENQLMQLENGVTISVNKTKYQTLPAKVLQIAPPILPERNPPIRFRKDIPTDWLEISIREGKNRQVRKMTAAVNLPTLRLIRVSIEDLTLGDLQPAEFKTWERAAFFRLLNLRY